MIHKYRIAADPDYFLGWPDVALTRSGKLICLFNRCLGHVERWQSCIMMCESLDRGRMWSEPTPFTQTLSFDPALGGMHGPYWNCPRIRALGDGTLVVIIDQILGPEDANAGGMQRNDLWFSHDEGKSWVGPVATPVEGIVPDRPLELRRGVHAGSLMISAQKVLPGVNPRTWAQRAWLTGDRGQSWSSMRMVAQSNQYKLCEGSLLEFPGGELVCFLRENSFTGLDGFKCISHDGGLSWSPPVRFALPGCHRPVAGMLASGRVMISYRFFQGGAWGSNYQNTMLALTDVESCLMEERHQVRCRIMPLDYDRALKADTGYTGWVQFPDTHEIYMVNYITDDGAKAQIRGYSFDESEFIVQQ